jgi:ATP-binding cassette subfamily F protein 3
MLSVYHLSKSYDIHSLFEDVTFHLNPRDRIGLVGPNGCGKSTLMRILAGREQPDQGRVVRDNGLRIGYLPQGFELDPRLSVRWHVGRAAGEPEALEAEMAEVCTALARNPSSAGLQSRYDDLLRRVELGDPGRVASILSGLGLAAVDPDLPAGRLSGGQQTRLALALLLLEEPQLLLLDEPTNHLDIGMLQWLENWLVQSESAALIVSHDRVFLDHTATHILAFDPRTKQLREYAGNYTDYEAQRRAELERQWDAYQDQQMEIQRMREDIQRVKAQAARTERESSSVRIGGPEMKNKGAKDHQRGIAKKVAKKAKSRERKLERFLDAEERVERPLPERAVKLSFSQTAHLGQWAVQTVDLSVGYDADHPLLHGLNLTLGAGQRVALSGPNGCGKTSLLRTIAGRLPALAGELRISPNAQPGVMAQDQSSLDPNANAVETLDGCFSNETRARAFLAGFRITGEDALKPLAQLSYGQRALLMLARLIASGCNCLLLDEPINHLDIPSREHFEQALAVFDGAVLAVVHDRYFIERFANLVWWVEDGEIRQA